MEISFLGAAGEVTGSCFLVETGGGTRVLVDCGMFQGRDAAAKNEAALDWDVAKLDAVVLTHAHIDHSGLLPRLVARGFGGRIHATPATADLLGVMLPDAAHIHEKEAQWRTEHNARGEHRHRDDACSVEAPLYTMADAERCLPRLDAIDYGVEFSPARNVRCRFRDAGHILGSAIVEAQVDDGGKSRKLVFSGDLGQPGRPLLDDPASVARGDVVVVESTYGNRLHKTLAATYEEFSALLRETLPGGNVVIPAFAVGRTQEVLHVLTDLVRQNRAPDLTIFVDSPLATRATEITLKYAARLDAEGQAVLRWQQSNRGRVRVRFTETADESKALNSIRAGAVIIAASGMCDAGRVRHHLRHNLSRTECAVVFTGFQAAGTLGRQIVDGAREVRLFREDIPVRARIATIGGLSAHADQAALLGWVRAFEQAPSRAFVVHGEHETAMAFAERIRSEARWPSVEVPPHGARYHIV